MNMKAIVIGVGYLGRFHAQKYAAMKDVELVGVLDASPERAADVAAEVGCRAFNGLEEAIHDTDIASVVVPTIHHHRVAMALLENGIHCLVEKPIATTVEEAEDLIDMARQRGQHFRLAISNGSIRP